MTVIIILFSLLIGAMIVGDTEEIVKD
jgi:hypothetical protein